MSRPTFLTTSSYDTNEKPTNSSSTITTTTTTTTMSSTTDQSHTLRFHHRLMPTISTSSRSHETSPIVIAQSSSSSLTSMPAIDNPTIITTTHTPQNQAVVRINPKIKRNLRGKRRSTGIRPEEVTLASASLDMSHNEDNNQEEDNPNICNQFITITSNTEPSESFDPNRTSPPKPVFKVSRVQPTFDDNSRRSFEKLSITRTDPYMITTSTNAYSNQAPSIFRPEEFILRRQPSDDDSKRRQYEERIRTLESLVYEKDSIIHDLQRKLEKVTRDLNDAEQQIYILQRDKLTLIKTITAIQEQKPSPGQGNGGEQQQQLSSSPTKRTGFLTRN